MTGDIDISNNATYGFNDSWFVNSQNIKLKNPEFVAQLLADIQNSNPGIKNINIAELLQMKELQNSGTRIANNLTDFYGNPVSATPSIGPLELK